MTEPKQQGIYQQAVSACVKNGASLLEDAENAQGWDHHGTAYALAILAEEEFSKAFILYLAQDGAIPWSAEVLRAIRDHRCKHLMSVLMDHLAEKGERWLEATMQNAKTQDEPLPSRLVAAMNLFRHEKIGKWASASWDILKPSDYDPLTKQVADGSVDRAKQSAIYVNIGKDGSVITTPSMVPPEEASKELDHCRRLKELAGDMDYGFVTAFREYSALKRLLQALFDPEVIAVGIMEE